MFEGKNLTSVVTFHQDEADQQLLELVYEHFAENNDKNFSGLCKEALWYYFTEQARGYSENQGYSENNPPAEQYSGASNVSDQAINEIDNKLDKQVLPLLTKLGMHLTHVEKQHVIPHSNQLEYLINGLDDLAQTVAEQQQALNTLLTSQVNSRTSGLHGQVNELTEGASSSQARHARALESGPTGAHELRASYPSERQLSGESQTKVVVPAEILQAIAEITKHINSSTQQVNNGIESSKQYLEHNLHQLNGNLGGQLNALNASVHLLIAQLTQGNIGAPNSIASSINAPSSFAPNQRQQPGVNQPPSPYSGKYGTVPEKPSEYRPPAKPVDEVISKLTNLVDDF